ncbi:MAG: universal stress protein, partial [Rhodobacteraceae bacterium]|nr:universal stress protein [Paracoccaceae bacterium]
MGDHRAGHRPGGRDVLLHDPRRVAAVSGEAGPASRETILCAVDFSGDSAAALGWACRQAALTDARLVLLHVVHDPASSP